jgi:membrane-associated protease RseP (regulator of RpoE activity)
MYLLGVLFIALGISVSIALHEVGHLMFAKKFGVKVTQYMVVSAPPSGRATVVRRSTASKPFRSAATSE